MTAGIEMSQVCKMLVWHEVGWVPNLTATDVRAHRSTDPDMKRKLPQGCRLSWSKDASDLGPPASEYRITASTSWQSGAGDASKGSSFLRLFGKATTTPFVLPQNFNSFLTAQVRSRVGFRKQGVVPNVTGLSRTHTDAWFLRSKAPQELQDQTEAAFWKWVDVSHKFEGRMEGIFLANVFSPFYPLGPIQVSFKPWCWAMSSQPCSSEK